MPKPLHLTACLLTAIAVVASGCGEGTSTHKTVSTSVAASTPANTSSQAVSPSTSAKEASPASKAHESKTTEAKAKPEAKGPAAGAKATKPKPEAAAPPQAPPRHLFSVVIKDNWLETCKGAGGSFSSCECMFGKYEALNLEEGRALAELLGTEVVLKDHLTVPGRIATVIKECRATIT